MTDREVMRLALEALELHAKQYPHMQKGYTVDAITTLSQALDHVPDTMKMTEPDMGIDRGAWDDVPDATKWVDELRGGDETEQEPVAWMYDFLNTDNRDEVIRNWITQDTADIEREKGFNVRPLYAAPPSKPWVSLTDEERSDVIGDIFGNIFAAPQKSLSLARAIEAKLKEKNNG